MANVNYNIKDYFKRYNICLALNVVHYKSYDNLYSLLVFTSSSKNLFINIIIRLLNLIDWKDNNYDSIFVFFDWLLKMVYYQPLKVTINAISLEKVIFNAIVR